MLWKRRLELAFEGFLIVALSWAVYKALGWPRETALFPKVVGLLALTLVVIVFAVDIRRFRREALQPEPDLKHEMESEADLTDRSFAGRAQTEFLWLVGYGAAVWLTGFYPATYLYLLLYLIARAKLAVTGALIWSTAATGTVALVFYYLLQVQPYTGLIGAWFDR